MSHGAGVIKHKPTHYHGLYICHSFLHSEEIRSYRQECAFISHHVAAVIYRIWVKHTIIFGGSTIYSGKGTGSLVPCRSL